MGGWPGHLSGRCTLPVTRMAPGQDSIAAPTSTSVRRLARHSGSRCWRRWRLGTPLVVSDIPAFRDVASHAVFAITSDPDTWARTVSALIDDPERRAAMMHEVVAWPSNMRGRSLHSACSTYTEGARVMGFDLIFGPSVERGPRTRRIYLTFDDRTERTRHSSDTRDSHAPAVPAAFSWCGDSRPPIPAAGQGCLLAGS